MVGLTSAKPRLCREPWCYDQVLTYDQSIKSMWVNRQSSLTSPATATSGSASSSPWKTIPYSGSVGKRIDAGAFGASTPLPGAKPIFGPRLTKIAVYASALGLEMMANGKGWLTHYGGAQLAPNNRVAGPEEIAERIVAMLDGGLVPKTASFCDLERFLSLTYLPILCADLYVQAAQIPPYCSLSLILGLF